MRLNKSVKQQKLAPVERVHESEQERSIEDMLSTHLDWGAPLNSQGVGSWGKESLQSFQNRFERKPSYHVFGDRLEGSTFEQGWEFCTRNK